MSAGSQPKIAFIGWNPFQFLHFSQLASRFQDPVFIVEHRKAAREVFDFENLPCKQSRILHHDRDEMRKLDGKYDVIVCQTPFAGIEEIRKSKIAMLQYGYAKEAHNFAPWRSFADVCMTFGDYATRKIQPYSTGIATGNPRYDTWCTESLRIAALRKYSKKLDPSRKTILYAPTWGELSSYDLYADSILALSDRYNIILKIHHNTQLAGKPIAPSNHGKFTTFCDTNDDIVELLALSDLMISDYSGAIFDAIHCRIPVLLLNHSDPASHASAKSDPYSLEQSDRKRIGREVGTPLDVRPFVEETIEGAESWIAGLESFRSDLFIDTSHASTNARDVNLNLASGAYHPNQSQSYIRQEMINYYRCRRELSATRTFGGWIGNIAGMVRKKFVR